MQRDICLAQNNIFLVIFLFSFIFFPIVQQPSSHASHLHSNDNAGLGWTISLKTLHNQSIQTNLSLCQLVRRRAKTSSKKHLYTAPLCFYIFSEYFPRAFYCVFTSCIEKSSRGAGLAAEAACVLPFQQLPVASRARRRANWQRYLEGTNRVQQHNI